MFDISGPQAASVADFEIDLQISFETALLTFK